MSQQYNARISQIHTLASAVKGACVNGALDGGQTIKCPNELADSILDTDGGKLLFESVADEHRGQVAVAWSTSIQNHCNTHGEMPSDALLASAAQSMMNTRSEEKNPMMFESVSATLATSDGLITTPKMQGLILASMLKASTSDMVTWIPADVNKSEIFELKRVAATKFGDYDAGQEIEEGDNKQFSSMKQFYQFPLAKQPDGTKTTFEFDTATDTPAEIKLPLRAGKTKIYHNNVAVAEHHHAVSGLSLTAINESGFGGSVDLIGGKISVNAPAGITGNLAVSYEVDIEKNPDLIPRVQLTEESYVMTPSWVVLGAQYTQQAYWMTNRELGVDLTSSLGGIQRNLIAYERDMSNLSYALRAAGGQNEYTFPLSVATDHKFYEHYRKLELTLDEASSDILQTTKKSGGKGIFAGAVALRICRAMGAPFFEAAPNFQEGLEVSYAGKLFGKYKVFFVPKGFSVGNTVFDDLTMLMYGRGNNHTDAGLVNGDAISPTLMKEGLRGFTNQEHLLALRYQDIHEKDGEKYFRLIRLLPE
ncbi:hypothetical protein [Pseudoalteromonas ruthenica]|uniref:hypothetical protein n=1 Tax=Pseudoalteromonas ruthenica TaxID=151081 RepID=UPI00110C0CD9|nr:hypothetical protein [Pseudoalteromonas ruthenica]TMO87710.1 hypothetical protein CWC12_10555 [Pseudoalteromonas ruthenica]TMP21515.1 hypothetical protein CWC06_18380 [Pseudoalteromonas ruthenica]